jgi:hypothetical protein
MVAHYERYHLPQSKVVQQHKHCCNNKEGSDEDSATGVYCALKRSSFKLSLFKLTPMTCLEVRLVTTGLSIDNLRGTINKSHQGMLVELRALHGNSLEE